MTNLVSALFGIAFASGLNVYATVLGLGLLHRFGVIDLPPSMEVVSSFPVLTGAAVLYLVEFIADKVPYVDSAWDAIHTVIRPAAGALMAYSLAGEVRPEWQILAALAGGSIALTAHTAKASTRAAANVSPEPFSNSILSVLEDLIAFGLVWMSSTHPLLSLVIVLTLMALAIAIIVTLSRFVRGVFQHRAA